MNTPIDMAQGTEYSSKNYGNFVIVAYTNKSNVEIEFASTKNRIIARAHHIRLGAVKDTMMPSIYGVGFVGVGEHRPKLKGKLTKSYQTWFNMMMRCYCEKLRHTVPTYKDCHVCDEWHNYQNFADWFDINYIDGMHLDKDIKIDGNKIYSPSTCKFVTQKENNVKAWAKNYKFISPHGEVVDVYNLKEFCKGKKIRSTCMSAVHMGKSKSHIGWTKFQ